MGRVPGRGSMGMLAAVLLASGALAQAPGGVSKVWDPSAGEGKYRNPVLFADYSDPDAIRVGKDFYLVSSSFESTPGLPILHSTDLVHWQLIGHALQRQVPEAIFQTPQNGNGVWAPSIRFHAGEFYIYYPDPETGIFLIKSKSILGPWSAPVLVKAAKGWIDPCPLWDDDGKAYLVNALAGSRSGAKSVVVVNRMSEDGTKLLDGGTIAIDGHDLDVTLEGPKIYKRHGYYYVFAPSGGVTGGVQVVFRSKSIYGPYERRVVLAQGGTKINGPHQGAWVTTMEGEDWFLHFQDRGAFGRVTRLEPMSWGGDDWPRIGIHQNDAGTGEPVETYAMPRVAARGSMQTPADSDEFNAPTLGLQWEWEANPQPTWGFPVPALGVLRLYNVAAGMEDLDMRKLPNVLAQKIPGPSFTATAKIHFVPRHEGDKAGLVVMGHTYSALMLEQNGGALTVRQESRAATTGAAAKTEGRMPVERVDAGLYLRVAVDAEARGRYSVSSDGEHFQPVGSEFQVTAGVWVGAKLGLFAVGEKLTGESGYADFDWIHFER